MLSISRLESNLGNNVIIKNYSSTGDYNSTARISRTATLDGSSDISHYGTSYTDMDFNIKCILSDEDASTLITIYEAGETIRLSYSVGVNYGSYLAYIYSLKIQSDREANIIFYLKEKLS